MAERIGGVHPTRMELLEIKKKSALARRGHHMLKEKRDALVMEFFGAIKKARGVRARLGELMDEGYIGLTKASALIETKQVRSVALGRPESVGVNIKLTSIMGVRVHDAPAL